MNSAAVLATRRKCYVAKMQACFRGLSKKMSEIGVTNREKSTLEGYALRCYHAITLAILAEFLGIGKKIGLKSIKFLLAALILR